MLTSFAPNDAAGAPQRTGPIQLRLTVPNAETVAVVRSADVRQTVLCPIRRGIAADNDASLRLHERLGFVETSHMPEVGFKFGRWLDLVLMQKALQAIPGKVDTAFPSGIASTQAVGRAGRLAQQKLEPFEGLRGLMPRRGGV